MFLAGLIPYLAKKLPKLTIDKTHLFIVNGSYKDGYLDYTARLLFLDCRSEPIIILSTIKKWLRENHRHNDANGNEIELSFNCELVDADTFDLEIDFPQRDKINLNDDGYTICKHHIWDEQLGFIQK